MGGRGSRSASGGASIGLPRGAAGMTVQFENGRRLFYKTNSAGVVLSGGSISDSASPVRTKQTIREIYDRAVGQGYKVELHSKSDVKRGEQANAKRRAENARDIASAEVGGTSQSRKLSKNSGRIVSSKRRGR